MTLNGKGYNEYARHGSYGEGGHGGRGAISTKLISYNLNEILSKVSSYWFVTLILIFHDYLT
jgi:hypothetical protein